MRTVAAITHPLGLPGCRTPPPRHPHPHPHLRTPPSPVQAATAVELQRRSPSGVIDLVSATFDELATGKSRPYSLFIVADAKHLHGQDKLGLPKLMAEYALVAKALAATHAPGSAAAGKVVLARIEFSQAKEVFGR